MPRSALVLGLLLGGCAPPDGSLSGLYGFEVAGALFKRSQLSNRTIVL